jgi:acetyltransferase
MKLLRSHMPAAQRLSICPYPKALEEMIVLPNGRSLLLRPIRPEDEPALQVLFSLLSIEEVRLRFLHSMKMLSHDLAARLTQIDYDRDIALVLCEPAVSKETVLYGSVRFAADPDRERAEFAILIRRDMTGQGLGRILMQRIIDYARQQGIDELFGEVLAENRAMLGLCDTLGFKKQRHPESSDLMMVSLRL